MKFVLIIFSVLFIPLKVFTQDTAVLYFKKIPAILPRDIKPTLLNEDTIYSEVIFKIGDSSYFYIRTIRRDNRAVEFGQLRLYVFSGRSYLMREGDWVIEHEVEKIIFANPLQHLGIKDEVQIDPTPVFFEQPKKHKKHRKKIRSAGVISN